MHAAVRPPFTRASYPGNLCVTSAAGMLARLTSSVLSWDAMLEQRRIDAAKPNGAGKNL
jgi:hypothetical protein